MTTPKIEIPKPPAKPTEESANGFTEDMKKAQAALDAIPDPRGTPVVTKALHESTVAALHERISKLENQNRSQALDVISLNKQLYKRNVECLQLERDFAESLQHLTSLQEHVEALQKPATDKA